MRTTMGRFTTALAAVLLGASAVDAGSVSNFDLFKASRVQWSTSFEFPTMQSGEHDGFYWPVNNPTSTYMFAGAGASWFNQGQDNTICWGYNSDCSGPFSTGEHFFNIVLEGSYDQDPAPGTDGQNWVEVNWNYGAAGALCPPNPTPQDGCWRPLSFILDEGLNSARGGAMWFFNANDEGDGDNSSLILNWPWASVGARNSNDYYQDSGFSSWTRTSTYNPGGTAYGIKGVFYLDHADARSGPYQVGLDMLTDYNSTETDSRAGGIIGGRFTARTSGSTDNRDAVFLDGLHVNVESASSGTGMTLNSGYGIRVHQDFGGKDVTFNRSAALYVDQPDAPGTSTATRNHYGVLIDDQRFDRPGMEGGQAISITSQTTTDGTEGNLYMAGGTHNTGHVQLARDHVWSDTTNNRLRFKSDAAPTSATDGKYLVMGGTAGGYGPVGWAQAGVTCDATCSFMGGTCERAMCLETIGQPCNALLKQVACNVTDAKRMCLCN